MRSARLLRLTASLALLPGWISAQTRVHHEFGFDSGDEAARIRVSVEGFAGPTFTVQMAAWTGRYAPGVRTEPLPKNFALRARDGDRTLVVNSPRPGVWSVATAGAKTVVLEYAFPLTGSKLEQGLGQRNPHRFERDGKPGSIRYHEALVLEPARTWLRIDGSQQVSFRLPPGFAVASALLPGDDGRLLAADAATLAGAPIHIGRFQSLDFKVDGRSHRVVLSGFDGDRTDREALTTRLAQIVRANQTARGPLPYASYVFLFGRRSGLAHATGYPAAAEVVTARLRSSRNLWQDVAAAHLAAFDGPAFHPAARDVGGPGADTLTAEAWFWIGVPEYFTELALVRCGETETEDFWDRRLLSRINPVQLDERRLTSPVATTGAAMASPQSTPSGPHPRLVGYLLALLLDVEIRANSGGRASLADAVRALAATCAERGHGYTNADIRTACEKVAGASLADLFHCLTTGKELPLAAVLAKVGLRASPLTAPALKPRPGSKRQPPRRRRPPRWRIEVDPAADPTAVKRREAITGN